MNISFLIICLVIGSIVDWIFQTSFQATNKSKWNFHEDDLSKSLKALIRHSLNYALLTMGVMALCLGLSFSAWLFGVLYLWITHALIDTRIPVKWVLKLKGMTDEQINDFQNFGFMTINVDQRLHELCILILALFI